MSPDRGVFVGIEKNWGAVGISADISAASASQRFLLVYSIPWVQEKFVNKR